MQDPTFDLVLRESAAFEETVHKFAHSRADHLRHVFRKKNVETAVAQVEAHRIQRIGKSVRFGRKNLGTAVWPAGDDDGCGAIAKKNRRDKIRLRNVFSLER